MSHLDEGTIHALLDGEIPSAELAPIQAHLDRCDACRARLAEEQELLAVSDRLIGAVQLPPRIEPAAVRAVRPPARPPVYRQLAWAATVVLAAGLGYAMGGSMNARPSADMAALREVEAASPVADSTRSGVAAGSAAQSAVPQDQRVAAQPPAAPPERRAAAGTRAAEETKDAAQDRLAPVSRPEEKSRALADSAGAQPKLQAETSSLRQQVVAGAANAPAPAAAAPPTPALRSRTMTGNLRLEEVVVTGVAGPAVPIEFTEAIRLMGGTIRLVEGLVPHRLEQQGTAVRVVYRTGFGELVLSQELVDGRVRHTLIPPTGFPADSLGKLRVKE